MKTGINKVLGRNSYKVAYVNYKKQDSAYKELLIIRDFSSKS